MRKLKLFTFLLALVASVGMSWATSQPIGYVDVCTAHPGSIHLVGWANDPDALSTSLPIHVYVDQPSGNSYINQHGYNLGTTDVWREDGVNPQYTGYHKIDRYINIMEASGAGTYRIRAYALDAVGNNGNLLMPHSYLGGMPTTPTLTVPAPYSITYNANGGNGAPAADYKCYGIDKTLSSTVPTRDGYTFIGWNTEQNGSGESYAAAGTYTANAGATLYAVWTPMTYTTGSWMRVGYNTGRTNTPNATSGAHYYNGFNGNLGGWGTVSYIEDANRGIGYQAAGNGKNTERKGVYSIYKNEQTIPSYSKRRMTGTFTLNSSDAKYKSTAALYAHNNQSELENYSVDFTHGLNDGTGSSKRITYVVNETKNGSWQSNSANYTYDFDNSTGSAEATKGWYILLAHTIVTDAVYDSGVAEKASFKSTSENYTWYYYKYVTFDPNGGTGDMAVQTVENSAQLHHNAFSRTGYSFAGWNTQPDGNGTAYDNEAVITATATNKGPVTLYAQWNEIPTPDPQQDPTIFAGFTATAGCDGFGGEDHTKLVDGKFTSGNEGIDWTKWCADSQHKSVPSGESEACWWVDFYAENPINVTGYILTTGNDNTQYGQGRNPNSWKIKAKLNAGDAWTTIATVTNDNTMQVADFTDFSFTLDQAGTYKYFRFMVYEPEYDNCMQLCELRFTGNGAPAPTPTINDILQELYDALGNDVWAGYGEATGVITYAQGTEPNSFKATFMGGAYAIEIPFGDFTQAEKVDNGDGTYTYNLDVNLPAQTGLSHEVLHVTTNANGEITGIHSDIAQTDMNKVGGVIATWADLNAAMANGGVLQLSQSLTATNLDGALIVPAGKTVVLELNGFSLDRHLASEQADGCVIINNGTLAITDNVGGAEIKGGYNSGNGGGIVNNGTFTLYGGKITANHAAQGAGVYNSVANDGNAGFWMTGGLIDGNEAASYPAIKGDVTFSNLAVVQINAQGATVSAATAIAGLATYDYIKPVMPNMDMFAILAELHAALGNDVWAGYGDATGVITYAQGTEPNSFKATFMGGAYAIEIPFGDFTYADKVDNGDGTFTYNLNVNLPAQTGMDHEVLHVTVNSNGEITGIESELAETEMNKLGGAIATWADLNAAMANGGVLQLSQSLTATNLDGALIVPAGKTVVLELNGFSLDRHLASEQADGCVIINNGTLAITDNVGGAEIKGGYNSGNGGGIVNNGTFTLYGGKITGNHAAQGAGVYNSVANNGTVGFWMTGGLIADNDASSYKAIKGDVTFNNLAVVQINAGGNTVSAATAIAGLATYDYIKPVMPNMDMFAILAELHAALGSDVWAGYGEATGVITYAQGTEPNSFKATFMGGAYAIEIPFGDFTQAEKVDNGNGTYTYNLDVNLPAQTGLSHEVLHVTTNANGEITGIHSDIAQTDMNKVGGAIATWADLNAAMANGGVLQLSQSLTATNLDGALIVPAGKTVVLDLNGFSLDRHLTSAQADGCVIINNGTLAITDNVGGAEIKGGNNSGNGGGIVNNGTFTLYGGKITGNHAAQGAGVYNSVANDGTVGFWMTGGLIAENSASSYPAIKGDVTFNNLAVVQVDAQGTTVSAATAIAGLATYDYIKPVMPNMDMFAILAELHAALGNDVWAGYGDATGVITYAQGTEPNSFKATFMGGAYAIEIPFGDFTQAEKVDNGNGTYTYNLDVNLPAQTGLSHEVLHVTTNANGEITGIHSDIAQTDMNKVGGAIATWTDLNAAMANGGVLQLSQSLTATNLDGALIVPAGKTVVLDLNGFSLDRHLTSAQADGCVIINNGTLAITDNVGGAEIKGGYNSGNGGGIVNNGTFTLYGGKITGNHAAQGAGVYNSVANDGNAGFWMTGGLIAENSASSYPAIKGDVTFSNLAVVQINAGGNTVSAATAIAGLATYDYIKPVMPNMDMFAILAELHNALGNDVWAGYGTQTGVISYAQGDEPNSFKATFMGGTYEIEIPFGDFVSATKTDNGDGTFTYDLVVNLPAQTGMSQETLHVTTNANGEILAMESENAGIELQKETDGTIATWADLQNALNNGGVIKLTNDIVGGNAPLEIPAGKTVVLDLNGYTIDRGMTDAAANGSVIVNNGTLAIVDNSDLANGVITGGKTTGNGGGVLNNGIFTLYAGEITGNEATIGGGVYNNGGAQGFWMTGGLIDGNTATTSNPAIGGDVIFNNMAQIQINADGDKVSIDDALAGLATYDYIKPIMPSYDDYTTEVPIAANNDPQNDGTFYSTFYDSANNYILPEGVAAYVADLSGSDLVLTRIAMAGQVIPADNAVILVSSVANYSMIKTNAVPITFTANNDLEGVDEATPLTDIPGLTAQNCYVLSGTNEYGVGFYRINVGTLKAHKAYVKYAGLQNNAPKKMRFVFGQATGIEDVQGNNVQSTKVIENGVLYIIRDGKTYNAMGQMVK